MRYSTLKDLKEAIEEAEVTFTKAGYKLDEIPVILTDDDEINGVHTPWNRSGITDQEFIQGLMSTGGGVSVPPKALKSDYFFIVG